MQMRYAPANRVFIVDDHPIARQGLCQVFDREPDFTVCGEAATVADALTVAGRAKPDLMVTDLTLEGGSGIELARQLRKYQPNLPILIVSMHDEQLYAARALAAGARGYVMKRQAGSEILYAAREVLAGHLYLSEEMRGRLLYDFGKGPMLLRSRPSPTASWKYFSSSGRASPRATSPTGSA